MPKTRKTKNGTRIGWQIAIDHVNRGCKSTIPPVPAHHLQKAKKVNVVPGRSPVGMMGIAGQYAKDVNVAGIAARKRGRRSESY